MSRYKHLADLLKICSVLPALAVMPAFAAVDITEGQVIENQTNNDGANQNAAGLTITYGDSLTTSGVNNVTFNNNSSVNSGGAMKALNGFVAGDGWTFTNNHSDKISGGLYVKIPEDAESNRNIVLGNGTTFSGNTSVGLGGALGIESAGTVTIGDNTKFESNSTEADGGAIAIWTDKSNGATSGTELTLGRTDFTGNTAANRGGAIANLNNDKAENKTDFYNTVNIASGSTFTGNSAKTGGAIYNLGTMNVDGTFDGNSTTATRGHGGAIYNAGEMSVAGTFKNNTATNAASQGGAIYNSGTLTVADNTVFSGNSTDTGDGGAIYNSGTLNIGDNVTFSGNTGDGTLFMGTGATTTIGDNVKFVDNTHGTRGLQSGAISTRIGASAKNSSLTIDGATFTDNTAGVNGGAIYNTVAMTLNGENVFSGNMAGDVANDIHNIGTMTVASGTTTLGGGITGNGALTIADGATLDIGTTTVEQASIDIDGTLNASMLNSDNYGKLLADSITTGENGKLQLTIGSVGTYDIFGGIAHEDITIDAGLAYDVINNGADGIEIAIKAVEDIAADTGLSNQGAATIAVLANTDDDVLTAISLRAQTELAAGNVDYVEHETAKLNPENKPVAHSISSSVQNQVLSLAAGRMTGGTVGRSGGDLANADYGIWAQGLYNHSKLNGQFKGDTTGISVGADALIDGKYTIGIGYAYNDTDVDSDSRDTKIESNSLFLYGQYKPNNWYVNAALNYTMGNYTETSNPFGVQFESEYDVDSFGGQVMTGYDFASGLTPEIGARYLHISQDAYDVALGHVDGADMDYLTGVAGIRYAFEIESDMELKFRPELRAAATYDFLSDAAVATITAPGSVSYVIDADRLSRFGGEFGIGLAAEWRGLTVSLNYDLDLHEDYTSQTGMLKFRYDF